MDAVGEVHGHFQATGLLVWTHIVDLRRAEFGAGIAVLLFAGGRANLSIDDLDRKSVV